MSICPILILALTSMASSSYDAVESCRAIHARDSAAHIACLEDALRQQAATKPADANPAETNPVEEIGLDQVISRERARGDGPKPVAIHIISVTYDGRERGTFRTADGQVWRETELLDRRPRLSPSKRYTARIERGMVGGYRMYVDGIRWMYKVERLE